MLKGLLFPVWGLDLVPVAPQFSASVCHLIVFTWLPSCTLLVMSSSQCIETSALSRGLFDSYLWHVPSGCWCILVCVPDCLRSLLLYQSWVLVERKIRTRTNQVYRPVIKSFFPNVLNGLHCTRIYKFLQTCIQKVSVKKWIPSKNKCLDTLSRSVNKKRDLFFFFFFSDDGCPLAVTVSCCLIMQSLTGLFCHPIKCIIHLHFTKQEAKRMDCHFLSVCVCVCVCVCGVLGEDESWCQDEWSGVLVLVAGGACVSLKASSPYRGMFLLSD